MNLHEANQALAAGDVCTPGVLPKVDQLMSQNVILRTDFGLDHLPDEPGLLLIRGARQYGKSTWMQQQIKDTVETFGPGSAYFINGDDIRSEQELQEQVSALTPLFNPRSAVRRIFIDEITAIKGWEKALKRLLDRRELANVLVVTTGSKAVDLRRGAERLPGRKGQLARTNYLFAPVSYREFRRAATGHIPDKDLLAAYLLSGGSPQAILSLIEQVIVAPYVVEIVRDWIYGEFASSGRSRDLLLGVLEVLYRCGGSPCGYSRLSRESGMANNTVASGYLEQFADLMCVAPAFAWEAHPPRPNRRRPAKFHFINLLCAMAWHPARPRTPSAFHALPSTQQAIMLEWLVAQECWRRAAIRGDELPDRFLYWQTDRHELDFVLDQDNFIEVKRGRAGPLDFAWFGQTFPRARLTVITSTPFETAQIKGVRLDDWLLE